MNYPTRHRLKDLVKDITGTPFAGVAAVTPVSDEAQELYRQWISSGRHGEMKYMERYADIRRDPSALLEGASTIIMAAFSYANPEAMRQMTSNDVPLISEYALGSDYHTVLRKSMTALGERITADFGGTYRVCIDTAPLRERYWAQQAGLGFIGRNNYLIIPGHGAHFFLAALLWTGTPVDGYDEPCALTCGDCGKCREACPTGALKPDGGCDTRRCLSYLTIECCEPLPDGINARNNLFGCDICRNACPHQPPLRPATDIPDFTARQEILSLSFDDWAEMTEQRYNTIFKDSAVKRAKLPKLKANASFLANKKS